MRQRLKLVGGSVHCSWHTRWHILTEAEVAVLVADALAEVDVASLAVAIDIPQGSTEDRNVAIALKSEVDVVCTIGEALAVPSEVACRVLVATQA